MTVPAPVPLLTLDRLDDAETSAVRALGEHLDAFGAGNMSRAAYYEGSARIRDLGIAIPPSLRAVETVVGWPGTTVDTLEERLDLEGFTSPEADLGLDEVFAANNLDVESGLGHLDALIHGIAFAVVGSGAAGEPDPLVTVESPMRMTGVYDLRARRLSVAMARDVDDVSGSVAVTLYLPDQTVVAEFNRGVWVVVERDMHRLGRVPVARLVNRPRSSRQSGRSEITRAVRAYTDMAVRTLLGMEVNREFYSAPQRYVLGADESAFTAPDGTVKTQWEAVMGRVWAIGRDENGDVPEVGTFTANSPTPYIEHVKLLAQLLAAEAGIPSSYLGFHTENPSSADAIRQAEARLIKRAERRQRMFGLGWLEAARLALLVRDGSVPAEFASVRAQWADASTPTRAASADEAVKLVGAGILPADSEVVLDRLGLSPADKKQLAADRRRSGGSAMLRALAQGNTTDMIQAMRGVNGNAG